MVKGLSTPIGMSGILLIVIGLVMTIIGIILLIVNQNKPKEWYIWLLLILGAVMGIVGGLILAIGFSNYENKYKNICPDQNCPDQNCPSVVEQKNDEQMSVKIIGNST